MNDSNVVYWGLAIIFLLGYIGHLLYVILDVLRERLPERPHHDDER